MKFLAISGSLKPDSVNTAILRAMAMLLPVGSEINFYSGLGDLPHFSPERDTGQNAAVNDLRAQLKGADVLIISTPEYAFGLPGSLKNALDWSVSSGEINEKPVAVISASPLNTGGDKAQASLLLTLKALGARVAEKATLQIPNVKKKIGSDSMLLDLGLEQELKKVITALIDTMNTPVSYSGADGSCKP